MNGNRPGSSVARNWASPSPLYSFLVFVESLKSTSVPFAIMTPAAELVPLHSWEFRSFPLTNYHNLAHTPAIRAAGNRFPPRSLFHLAPCDSRVPSVTFERHFAARRKTGPSAASVGSLIRPYSPPSHLNNGLSIPGRRDPFFHIVIPQLFAFFPGSFLCDVVMKE